MANLKWTGRSILLALTFGATLLSGCGSDGDSGSTPNDPSGNSPAPTVTSISPSSADAGGSAFLLTVNGTNFVIGSIVRWGTTNLPTTVVSSTQLTANVDGSLLASSGFAQVTVSAPTVGGGISSAVSFNILAITPFIASLNPSSGTAGSASLTLTVTGSKFVAGSTVRWGGIDRPTTFVSSTVLTAAISSTDLSTASTSQVTVRNPPAIGGTSTEATFTILPAVSNSVPTIASLLPSSLTAGVTGLAVTVTGTGFVAATVGQWNGANRATIVKSSTQLLLLPLPGDMAAGTALVTVANPAPGGGMSGSLVASISALPSGAVGVTDRLSVAGDSTEALGSSYGVAAISPDGRFIAFSSEAGNLVPGDTNAFSDVFVRDTCRGASSACTPSITRVSVANDGSQAVGTSTEPVMSAGGRFVSFTSSAANLVPGDANVKSDVFLRDTCTGATGCVPSTTLVSVSGSGVQGANDSRDPAISADGRFVSFVSLADNLVSGDTNASQDVFLRDTCVGASACSPSTIRVSVANDGAQATGSSASESYYSAMSADGRFVVFASRATNLVASDTNATADIFLRDTCVGVSSCTPATVRVSLDSAGDEANAESFLPGMSADGRFVVFTSWATDMVPDDTSGGHDVFVRDTCRGATASCTPSNRRVSVGSNGAQANQNSGGPATGGASISGDGRFVAFGSRATNLVGGDNVGQFEIFLYDSCEGASGCVPSTKRLSAALDGTQSTGSERSDAPVISTDGRFVAFTSDSTAFLPGDTNDKTDVFLARTGAP